MTNPDLHLARVVDADELVNALQAVVGQPFTLIEDLSKMPPISGAWANTVLRPVGDFPESISIYGVRFDIEMAKKLAQVLNCGIATDYDETLREYEWQYIDALGNCSICTGQFVETDDDCGLRLTGRAPKAYW